MAPEAMEHFQFTQAADVYSVGESKINNNYYLLHSYNTGPVIPKKFFIQIYQPSGLGCRIIILLSVVHP